MGSGGQRIEVTEQGNYRVIGRVPIYPGRIVRSADGSSLEWELGEPDPSRSRMTLCRCGRSGTKPFCDSTHETITWDGGETADPAPTRTRRRAFPGSGVTLTDDLSLCSSAAFCHDRLTDVWHLTVERSWEPEVRRRVEGIVARCPSGRLVLARATSPSATAPTSRSASPDPSSPASRGRLAHVWAEGRRG